MKHYILTPEELQKVFERVCDNCESNYDPEYCLHKCPLDKLYKHPVDLIKINNNYQEV